MKNVSLFCMLMAMVYGGKLEANVLVFRMNDVPLNILFSAKKVYLSAKLYEIILSKDVYQDLLYFVKRRPKYLKINQSQLFMHRSLSRRFLKKTIALDYNRKTIHVDGFSFDNFAGIAVKATSFEPQVIASKGVHGDFKMNRWDMGVALPSRKYLGKHVLIYYPLTKKHVVALVNDVGPWNINDPWIETGKRPQAENGIDHRGRKTNKAGIDLSYPVWVELGVSYDKAYSGNYSDYVKFILLD
ncbi:hypothetical protein MJH12_03215 [bacterium]|nr:hypothetical protein [bacterium]